MTRRQMDRVLDGARRRGAASPGRTDREVAADRLVHADAPGPDVAAARAPLVRTTDVLALMHRNGSIDDASLAAGRQFQSDFNRAGLDPLRAVDLSRRAGSRSTGTDASLDRLMARDAVWDAVEALGGGGAPAARACWWILGVGMAVRDFATGTPDRTRRPISHQTGGGLLVAGLGVLAGHYARYRRKRRVEADDQKAA